MGKTLLEVLLKSTMAGVCIGIGGTVYLSVENPVIGAFLFSLGLFFIVLNGLWLYTGKIGYLIQEKPKFLLNLLTTLVGNLIGTAGVGYALRLTRVGEKLAAKASGMCATKSGDSLLSILVLAFFCGILMCLAVHGFKIAEKGILKLFAVVMPVAVFILCGFEHCVANMYYYSVANAWSTAMLPHMAMMILGNSLGGMFALWFCTVKMKKEN